MDARRTISFTGSLDYRDAAVRRQHVETFLEDRQYLVYVVDLAAVTGIDTAGLSTLVEIRNHALRTDSRVILRDASPRLCRVIELSGLSSLFEYEHTT